MAEKLLNYEGLHLYDTKIKEYLNGRVNTMSGQVSANTTNIDALGTAVSGATSQVSSLASEVANLRQTVESGITTGSYTVDAKPTEGNTNNLPNSDGTYKAIVAETGYAVCNSAGSASTKSVTLSGKLSGSNGGAFKVKMMNKNTAAAPYLEVFDSLQQSTSIVSQLYYRDMPASETNTWDEGEVLMVYFSGDRFNACKAVDLASTYYSKEDDDNYLFGIADNSNTMLFCIDDKGNTILNGLKIVGPDGPDMIKISTDEDYQLKFSDGKGDVVFGITSGGTMTYPKYDELVQKLEVLNYIHVIDKDWRFVVVDADNNVMFGVQEDGTFYTTKAQIDELHTN